MKEFDIFRINCWLEDLDDQKYESSIKAIIYEYLMSSTNFENTKNGVFDYITKELGIRLDYDKFTKIVNSDENFLLEPNENDIYVKLHDETVEKFKERIEKHSIETYIRLFCEERGIQESSESIKNLLLKSLYININSFTVSDLKTLISKKIEEETRPEEIDIFNSFLDWKNDDKNKSIYALFSKSIEFAILTSGRGISSINETLFSNKTYFLDTNIVLRALGVDGPQRQESTLSIIKSCNKDGIKFKISKFTYDEIYKNLNNRTKDIENKTSPQNEKLLTEIIDELPFNNSFETDYLHKRKERKVSSPNNYRLSLEKGFQKLCDQFNIVTEPIKGVKESDLENLKEFLLEQKKKRLGKWAYSLGAALVDAKNILYVRLLRGQNNYNYRDIKSFYLTTDTTLNDILVDLNKDLIAETILPSQLFVIHNSFHKKTDEEDYSDFIKFIKVRRTDFKIPGQEIFSLIEQIQETTTDKDDIISSLKAYANYRFENRDRKENHSGQVLTIKEFTKTQLEKELGKARQEAFQLDAARNIAIIRLSKLFKRSTWFSYIVEIFVLSIVGIATSILNKNVGTTIVIILGVVFVRIALFIWKDKFGINQWIRNYLFDVQIYYESYYKIHSEDTEYIAKIEEMKKKGT